MTPDLDDFVNEAIQKEGLRFYFDTTVILDLLRPQRRPQARELLQTARSKGWTCVSSYYARMEALDVEQEHTWLRAQLRRGEHIERLIFRPRRVREIRRERELSRGALTRISNRFHKELVTEIEQFIRWVQLDELGWEEATTLAANTNISAPDCIHVATAIGNNCHVLVTSDEALQELAAGSIQIADPTTLLASLRE